MEGSSSTPVPAQSCSGQSSQASASPTTGAVRKERVWPTGGATAVGNHPTAGAGNRLTGGKTDGTTRATETTAARENTFRQMLANFSDEDLYRITRFYLPRIQAMVEDFPEQFASILKSEHIVREDEAEGINQLVRSGRDGEAAEFAVQTVMGRGADGGRAMWEMFVKLHPNKPKLEKILREIQRKGISLNHETISSGIESQVSDFLKIVQAQHKETLREQTQTLTVNIIRGRVKRKTVSLTARYTELILISSPREQSLVEHEIVARGRDHEEWQRKHTRKELERIHISQLLRSSFCKNSLSGTSVVGGVAGIGKTTLLQKMVHDWATGKVYPQFHFVFFFKFRELNVITERINLRTLVLDSYPYLSKVIDELWKEPGKLLFIFDGLDEFKNRIDFTDKQRNTAPQHRCFDPQFWCEVSDIFRCLIQGKVLPGCSVLITTRPTALDTLLEAELNLFVEIQGFLAEERKEYFQKFFEDEEVAAKAFAYVVENAILYTMCFNPSYCGILCSTLESFFTQKVGKQRAPPKTITQLYVNHIYNILTNHGREIQNPGEVLRKTGEMAFRGLHRKTIIFNSDHLHHHHLQPCVFLSGFMMELLEKDRSAHNVVYTFHHLTIQEFVAALAQFLTPALPDLTPLLEESHSSPDGRFQVFLRFLIGLSAPHTKAQLEEVLGSFPADTTRQVIDWLKRRFANIGNQTSDSEFPRTDLLNICHYLFESQNRPLMKATIGSLKTIDLSHVRLSPVDCTVVAAGLEPCEVMEEINLEYCYIQTEGIQRLVSVLHKFKSLRLGSNNLGDSGVKSLCEALRNPECKIQTLGLDWNSLTDGCTDDLVSALSTSRSLRKLDLVSNSFTDASVPALRRLTLTCTSLERIWLGENQFSSDGERQLTSLGESRAGLSVIVCYSD